MAQAEKILLRLTKGTLKVSTVIDATNAFNKNNAFYQDLSGWDRVIVEIVNSDSPIYFKTTNDNGYITGDTMPAPEVPINWESVLGIDLTNDLDISSINGTGIVKFDIIGKYLQLAGSPTNWYLYKIYSEAGVDGSITFPDHVNHDGSLNPNLVGICNDNECVQLYINVIDATGSDKSNSLMRLVGNETNLTLIQGANIVTYHCTNEAFQVFNNNVFYDNVYGDSPLGSLTLISPSANPFNIMDEIKIFIEILTPVYTYFTQYDGSSSDWACTQPTFTGNIYTIDSSITVGTKLFYNNDLFYAVSEGYYLLSGIVYTVSSFGIVDSIVGPCLAISAYSYVISGIDLALAIGNTDTNLNGKVYAMTADDGTGNPASRTFTSAGGYNHWLCSMDPIIPTFGYYASNVFVSSGLVSTQTNIGNC